jgi:hypothetical protein
MGHAAIHQIPGVRMLTSGSMPTAITTQSATPLIGVDTIPSREMAGTGASRHRPAAPSTAHSRTTSCMKMGQRVASTGASAHI